MAVIAMTREMATRGRDVAAGLAERLQLKIVHHEVVERDVARLAGLSDSEVHRLLEGEASLLDRWTIDWERLSHSTTYEVLEHAAKGNVLIRGWGASYILRQVPHVVGVRICAPPEFRETLLMERLSLIDRAVARREIERNDAAHGAVMQKLYGTNWRAPWLYTIVLNTARVPVADCVEHIVRLVESPAFAETETSRMALLDEVVSYRVRRALQERFGGSGRAIGFEANVANGKVTLTGACSDEHIIVEAVRLVHGVEGVRAVESRIEHIAFLPHVGLS